MELIERYENNPIIYPKTKFQAYFNPGVLKLKDKIYLLVRKVDDYCSYISKIDLFESYDGIRFNLVKKDYIKPELSYELLGVEDPRVSYVDNEIFITYTGISNYAWSKDPKPRIMLIKLYENLKYEKLGCIFCNNDDKNAVFLPTKINNNYILFHRPMEKRAIAISYSKDLKSWKFKKIIKNPEYDWEIKKVGIAFQPIEIKEGYLTFYHGVDEKDRYSVGFFILDKKEPWKIIYNYDEPIWIPKEWYEKFGDVPNVVFPTGYVRKNNKLYIYAGGSDKFVILAFLDLNRIYEIFNLP